MVEGYAFAHPYEQAIPVLLSLALECLKILLDYVDVLYIKSHTCSCSGPSSASGSCLKLSRLANVESDSSIARDIIYVSVVFEDEYTPISSLTNNTTDTSSSRVDDLWLFYVSSILSSPIIFSTLNQLKNAKSFFQTWKTRPVYIA